MILLQALQALQARAVDIHQVSVQHAKELPALWWGGETPIGSEREAGDCQKCATTCTRPYPPVWSKRNCSCIARSAPLLALSGIYVSRRAYGIGHQSALLPRLRASKTKMSKVT
jgi:hypothetical protein